MRFRGLTLLALMVLATAATPAWATLQLNIGGTLSGACPGASCTLTGGTVFTDGGADDLTPGTVGLLTVASGGINFSISIITGLSGSPTASLSMNATGVPQIAPQTVTLAISDNNFSIPPTPLSLTQTVNLLAASDGPHATATARGFFGENTNFDVNGPSTGLASGEVNTITPGTSSSVGSISGTIPSPTPYSLTSFITVNILSLATGTNQNLQVQANLSAVAVPEPASVLLLGTTLLGLTAMFRKKFKRS